MLSTQERTLVEKEFGPRVASRLSHPAATRIIRECGGNVMLAAGRIYQSMIAAKYRHGATPA